MADDGGLSAFTIYVRDLCSRSVLDDPFRRSMSVAIECEFLDAGIYMCASVFAYERSHRL